MIGNGKGEMKSLAAQGQFAKECVELRPEIASFALMLGHDTGGERKTGILRFVLAVLDIYGASCVAVPMSHLCLTPALKKRGADVHGCERGRMARMGAAAGDRACVPASRSARVACV